MWQSSSNYSDASSTTNEIHREDQSSTPSVSEVTANNATWSSSSSSFICYRIPVVTTPFVPQLLPSETYVEMNSNIRTPRHRDNSRRTFVNQRFHPYTIPNVEHCNLQNSEEGIFTHFNSREESSYRATIKGRGQCNESLLAIQQDIDRTPSVSRGHNLAENQIQIAEVVNNTSFLVPYEESNQTTLLHPSYTQPESPRREIENNFQNSYNSSNQKYVDDSVMTSLVKSTVKSRLLRKEKLKSKTRILIENVKPCFQHDDLLAPLLLLIPELPLPTFSAQKMANNLIKLSRYLKSPDPNELYCLDCSLIPAIPVTGPCGHTRCMRCILLNGACSCGTNAPKTLFVNTIVREIVEKMMKYIKYPSRITDPGSFTKSSENKKNTFTGASSQHLLWRGLQYRSSRPISMTKTNSTHCFSRPRIPMTVQARHRRARELICAGKFLEAAPHLARVAASTEPFARVARKLLAQTISIICQGRKRSIVLRKLSECVREQSAYSWLRPSDLECVLCTNTFRNPVSTPCGHTYCRRCIETSLYYKKKCALCLGPLENFSLSETRDTLFISSILATIDVLPLPEETDVIPIVTCYVAFPGMPCPLFIFDPRYWLMVHRVMQSGSRRFGMLAYDKGHTFADYGTVLEICDCVVFEDNRCIVSTVGVSRFRVLERHEKNGCDVARIQMLSDIAPTEDEIPDLHILAAQILLKTLNWLKNMDVAVQDEIETAFGPLPYYETPDLWWETADGPNWLWWLIVILPLKPEIKILIVSTRSLLKRMLAVSRTLDFMDVDTFTSSTSSEEPQNDLANQECIRRNR